MLERLGQQLGQQQHLHAAGTQQVDELVVFLLRPRHPGQPVEEQLVVVAWVEAAQLSAGPVQDGYPQRSDLGIGPQLNDTHA